MRSTPAGHGTLVSSPFTPRRAVAWLLLAVVACGGDPSAPEKPIEALPRELSADERAAIDAGNRFTFDLLRELDRTHEGKNLFVSPLSASMALGMTLNGARTSTYEAMRTALGLEGMEQPAINAAYDDLIELLTTLDRRVEMRVANSIWFDEGFPVEQAFLDAATESFDAHVEGLDFADPATLPTINAWVSDATAERIPALLDHIEPDEVMFLVNALYFKGLWAEPFDRRLTADAPFHLADGSTVTVPMMSREGAIASAFDETAVVVDLPYGGGAFSMTLLLPREGTTAEELVAALTPERWSALVQQLAPRRQFVELPRFRLEWDGSLQEPLGALGMAEAFDGTRADFSGVSQAVYDAGERLYITRVLQKTFVAVDEAGTEAAAATVVGMGPTSMPPTVRFDRPFVFAIRERFSGAILFIGKVADPSRTD